VFTLLTFCPPGPALRVNVNTSSAAGIEISALTTSARGISFNSSQTKAKWDADERGFYGFARIGNRIEAKVSDPR
jgi:hypothetical protein